MAPPPTRPEDTNKATVAPVPAPGSGYSYKRKRAAPPKPKESKTARLKEYGLDLPDIPGLPIQVIPLQLNALKVTTKFFQQDAIAKATTIPPYEVQPPDSSTDASAERTTAVSTDNSSSLSVMESIMNRLEKSTAALPPEEERLSQERTKRKKEALESWLEAIHRCVRDQRQYQSRQNNNNDDGKSRFGGGGKTCVPLAALEHLWDVGQSHKRLTVRRAALHCCGHLLQKSSDCRRWLFQEGTFLVDWMDVLAAATTLASTSSSSSTSRSTAITDQEVPGEAASTGTRIRFWQREALLLLQHFVEQGYSDLYPTLTVALLRLKQTCPMVVVSESDASTSGGIASTSSDRVHTMADWRRLRDVALQYAEQEERCVRKLIQRAQACMDILVPRLGVVEFASPPPQPNDVSTTAVCDGIGKDIREKEKDDNDEDDDDDDDEEDIDWEDGFDQDDGIPEENGNEPELHAAAVERTLAAIETTAGLQSGALEIDFDRQDPDNDTATNKDEEHALSEPAVLLARTRLIKCVGILFDRHMPRLAAWVEGLTCADGLVLQQKDGAASCFVTMSQDQAHRRKDVLGALLEVKSTVASILQSAQRLGIQEATTAAESREQFSSSNNTTTTTDQPAARRHPLVAVNLASSTRHEGLETSFQRRRRLAPDSDVSRQRSNRIQIKYRKT
jgi:hypothetical protein